MTEVPTEAVAADPAQETQPQAEENTDWKHWKAKAEEITAEARKWEYRSKENATKAAELDKQRKAAMTDAERSVAEAEARGRNTAASEFGRELARERFDALAGRRNPDFDTSKALEYVDLSKFLGEDGRPDSKVIAAAVERLVPTGATTPPSFDGGTRSPAPATQSMSEVIRRATGRA